MWTKPKTLDDVLPDGITGAGIFGALQTYDVPWKDDNINVLLDIEYQGNRSGQKYISPLVRKMMAGDELDSTELNIIAQVAFSMFNVNWTKQWATMEFEYNPIENYRMEEVMDGEQVHEYDRRDTRTDNLTHGKTGTESLQHGDTLTDTFTNRQHSKSGSEQNDLDRTETTTPNVTVATDDTLYGFNSAAGVPAQSQERSTTGTETKRTIDDGDKTYQEAITETGSETHAHSGTDINTYNLSETDGGTSANVASGSDTDSNDYTLTRSGNIGVTTSQQMIESERQLWIWNYFENVVFPDLDNILTLPLY